MLALSLTLLASPASASPTVPSYSGDFPDPGVLLVNGTYHAYSTEVGPSTNIPTMQSSTLLPNSWTNYQNALNLPQWAGYYSTWAPSVVANGSAYLMYYTAHDNQNGRQCIGVATATSPTGPFNDPSKSPLICQLSNGGSIDPNAFVAANGVPYLVWKSDDNSIGHPTHLWGQQLAPDGQSLVGTPVDVLDAQGGHRSWEDWVIEGPSMVLSGSTYYLFYGGNHWDKTTSGIGYATCRGPLGPCKKQTVSSPWMATNGNVVGPQGPSFFTDTIGHQHIAFDAWTCSPSSSGCQPGGAGYSNGYVRSLWLDTISFANGVPAAG